jgi:hypothetical protein
VFAQGVALENPAAFEVISDEGSAFSTVSQVFAPFLGLTDEALCKLLRENLHMALASCSMKYVPVTARAEATNVISKKVSL